MTLISSLLFLPPSPAFASVVCTPPKPYDTTGYESYTASDGCPAYRPILTPTETFEVITGGTTPTASLSIDGKTSVNDSITSSYGATNYASHTVSISVTGAKSYELILSGPAKLSGPSAINATAGATGANLANDTWGYAWENTTVTDANANYKALNSSIKLTGTTLNNEAASFSKKLVFAAKFNNANAGIYHADVNLSLIVTPAMTTVTANAVPWNKLVYMQDMTEYACMQAKIGDSKTLTDVRDNNTYTIAKLSDGKCWMTQNLRISQDTVSGRISSDFTVMDTNLPESFLGDTYKYEETYSLPASKTSFSSTDPSYGQVSKSTDTTYGAYYSFNAATAGTASSKTSGNAPGDICPKGWRLPTGNTSGEFQALAQLYPAGNLNNGQTNTTGWTTSGVNGKKGRWLGAANAASGGAFFPAAGYVADGGPGSTGSGGWYWSSMISTANDAYYLQFLNTAIYPAGTNLRYGGYSIRCVAK